MKSITWLPVILLVCWVAPVQADLTLKPIHPHESVAETLKQRFSLENALANIESIEGWLDSFRRLTAAAKGKIAARCLEGDRQHRAGISRRSVSPT